MLKTLADSLFSFDLEWVPDPKAGEILCGVDIGTPAGCEAAMEALWQRAGASADKPQPYLKTILCRIVSLAGILRTKEKEGQVELRLVSLPQDCNADTDTQEATILKGFLQSVGRRKPQLVGYNSAQADLPIIIQRAVVHGLPAYGFTDRPEKPWQGMDYFHQFSDAHIDLAPLLGRFAQTPSLHEAASLCGIPGKIDTAGGSVAQLWLQGKLKAVVDYNECDAFTTHLLWARVAHFAGVLTAAEYANEENLTADLLRAEISTGKLHLKKYLQEWNRLRGLTGQSVWSDS